MKRLDWLMTLTTLSLSILFLGLIPTGVGAQLSCEDPNLFALVFDEETITINLNNVGSYEQYDAYLYLLNPDPGCLNGFELEVIIPEQTVIMEIAFPSDALNFGTGGNFIVGFGVSQMPVDNRILLCTITLMNMSTSGEVQDFYMSPSTPASIDGTMAYLDCTENIVATNPISLDYSLPVARVNGSVPLVYCEEISLNGITVQISSQGDDDNLAGTSTWATDGYDPIFDLNDLELEPVVFFFHQDWDSPNGYKFRHDVMGAFDLYTETRTWPLTINSEFPQGQTPPYMVEVDFLPSFADDENIFLTLVDQTTGEITLLEAPYQHSYPIYTTESRTFDMVIGFDTIHPPVPALDVAVEVSCNGMVDQGNHAAAAEWATDGFDEDIDIPEPGPPPSNYLTASFTNDGWPFGPRFRTMVHAEYSPDSELKTWPLRVETDQIGIVELNFSPDFDETADIPLLIKDLQTGQIFSLFPDLTYTYENSNPSVRDFLIIVGNHGPPPLWPETKWIHPGWSLVGLPLLPTPGQDSLAETLLAQVNGSSYVYRYLGEDGYELESPAETAVHGRGYWLAVNETYGWTMEGEMALDPVTVPLALGWNMIGYPLWFIGSVENVQLEYQGKTYSWAEAVAEGYVLGSVMEFDSNSDDYQVVEELMTWSGYWFGALEEGVSLVFDWENFMELPSRISNPDRSNYPPEWIWTTELKVTDSSGHSHQVTFGVHPEASAGFDPGLDVPLAPSGPYNSGYMGLLRPEWDLPLGNKIFRDLVAPDGHPVIWNAEIVVAESGSVTLQWNRHDWPDDLDLQIYLPQENRVVLQSMRSQNSLRLPAPAGYLVVQFRTPHMSGVHDIPASAYRLGIHPNPFNPQTTISFELLKEGEVEIRIYSVRGEMVSVLQSDATGLGRHEVVWTGRDRSGREVPSGSYFARMYLDGKAVGPVAKMSLIR